jgi:hypothetical protein
VTASHEKKFHDVRDKELRRVLDELDNLLNFKSYDLAGTSRIGSGDSLALVISAEIK